MSHYKHPRYSVCVDTIVINKNNEVLLIKRGHEPFKDYWALPGGRINENEDLEDAARRELLEETSLNIPEIPFRQQKTYGKPGRDPRGHNISVVFIASLDDNPEVKGGDDAVEAVWFDVDTVMAPNFPLAFDHNKIMEDFCLKFYYGSRYL